MNNLQDKQLGKLVANAKKHDSEAVEQLYREFYPDVYFTCCKILENAHAVQRQ